LFNRLFLYILCWKFQHQTNMLIEIAPWSVKLKKIILFHFYICSTVSYEESSITYVWKNDEDTLRKSPSLTTLNAYLIRNKTDDCDVRGNWRGMKLFTSFSNLWETLSFTFTMLIHSFRKLFMFKSWADIYKGSCILLYNRFHTRNHPCYIILHHVLAWMECSAGKVKHKEQIIFLNISLFIFIPSLHCRVMIGKFNKIHNFFISFFLHPLISSSLDFIIKLIICYVLKKTFAIITYQNTITAC
jgi:hypothetical protein